MTPSPPRLNIVTAAPEVYQAMAAFDAATGAGLDVRLSELVRLRASQLNGCEFCAELHSSRARQAGEDETRITELDAWRDSALFTEAEKAALALVEAVTLVAETAVPDDLYAEAAAWFDETQLAHLIWTAAAVNAWNRVGVATRMSPVGVGSRG